MTELVIGIDPGVTGALALITDKGDLVAIADMPSLADGTKGRSTVNSPLLAELLARWHAREVFCEWTGPRPTDGSAAAFMFGRCRGAIEGVCGALSLRISFVTPQVWKRAHSIPPGKDGTKDLARSKAIALWPAKAELFGRVKDHNRAEACLIGVAGLMKGAGK